MTWAERSRGFAQERLRMFRALEGECGSAEDAMWAVLQQDRLERATARRQIEDDDPLAESILSVVCARYKVTRRDLLHNQHRAGRPSAQAARWCSPRWVAMRVLRDEGYSLPAIGHHMGRRHHTSVLHGLARVAASPLLVAEANRVRLVARGYAPRGGL